jgi:hypothetical protein
MADDLLHIDRLWTGSNPAVDEHAIGVDRYFDPDQRIRLLSHGGGDDGLRYRVCQPVGMPQRNIFGMLVHGFGSWMISWTHGCRSAVCPGWVKAATARTRPSLAIRSATSPHVAVGGDKDDSGTAPGRKSGRMLKHGIDVGSPRISHRGLAQIVAIELRHDGGEGKDFELSAPERLAAHCRKMGQAGCHRSTDIQVEMHDRHPQWPGSSFRQFASVEKRCMPQKRAQRGDPPVAGVWQRRFHCSLATGHLPAVNTRASSGMHAALAQGALESLSKSAAGLVAGSKPKLFRASALVTSRDSEGGRRPSLNDAPHSLLEQTVLILLRTVGAEKKCIFGLAFGEFLAQEFVDVAVGDFAGFGVSVEQPDDALLVRRQRGQRTFEVIRPARGRAQQRSGSES